MNTFKGFLVFLGIRADGHSEELVAAGRRRAVALLTFLSFVLVVASATAESWVSGGLEYTIPARRALSETSQGIVDKIASACPGGCFGASPAALGESVQVRFELGLSQVSQDTASVMPFTNEPVERDCSFAIGPFMRYVNAASQSNVTTRNLWYGIGPVDDRFNATLGLLGFSAFLLIVSWVTITLFQYEVQAIASSAKSLWVVRGLSIAASFFVLVAVLVFGSSNTKASFCQAFDPDAQYLSLPCGYGSGFDLAIAALIFCFFTAVLAGGYMSLDLPQTYHFSGSNASAEAATAGFNASGYNNFGVSGGSDESTSKGGVYSGSFTASSYEPIGTKTGGYQS